MAVHIINLRCPPDGEDITQYPQALPSLPSASAAQLILLVHGYNDSLMDAREAYASFLNPSYDQDLVRSLPPNAWPAYIEALKGDTVDSFSSWGEICLVFWPADVWGRGFSAAAYVPELELAADSAVALAGVLRGLPRMPQPQIALVCHSMGNRLALDMLNLNASIPCRAMCLMAAAVAVEMVTGSVQPDFRSAIGAIEKKMVLYSTSDGVLGTAFPLGEAMAGEGSGLEAVGLNGNPRELWGDGGRDMDPYGHGDYWLAIGDQAGTTSRDMVLSFLSATMPPYSAPSQIDSNPGTPSSSIASNALTAQQIESHRIGP